MSTKPTKYILTMSDPEFPEVNHLPRGAYPVTECGLLINEESWLYKINERKATHPSVPICLACWDAAVHYLPPQWSNR
jgi:hypothetical protein